MNIKGKILDLDRYNKNKLILPSILTLSSRTDNKLSYECINKIKKLEWPPILRYEIDNQLKCRNNNKINELIIDVFSYFIPTNFYHQMKYEQCDNELLEYGYYLLNSYSNEMNLNKR